MYETSKSHLPQNRAVCSDGVEENRGDEEALLWGHLTVVTSVLNQGVDPCERLSSFHHASLAHAH